MTTNYTKNDARRLRHLKASKKREKRREERLWVEARWDTGPEPRTKQTAELQATL
jgi:hypothetical protein